MDALAAAWALRDPGALSQYQRFIASADRIAEEMEQIAADAIFQPLKNARGRLTLGSVKDRIKRETVLDHRTIMERYVEKDGLLKKQRKWAAEKRDTAEAALIKAMAEEPESADFADLRAIDTCITAFDTVAELKSVKGEKEAALQAAFLAKYGELTDDEVKALIIEDKWLAQVRADVGGEVDRVSQRLAGRVKVLAERYATPLPNLAENLDALSAKVAAHLQRMGFAA